MINIEKYKKLLEEEKERLEEELGDIAEKNQDNPEDWVATPPTDLDTQADPNDAADDIEDYIERVGVERPLEEQLQCECRPSHYDGRHLWHVQCWW